MVGLPMHYLGPDPPKPSASASSPLLLAPASPSRSSVPDGPTASAAEKEADWAAKPVKGPRRCLTVFLSAADGHSQPSASLPEIFHKLTVKPCRNLGSQQRGRLAGSGHQAPDALQKRTRLHLQLAPDLLRIKIIHMQHACAAASGGVRPAATATSGQSIVVKRLRTETEAAMSITTPDVSQICRRCSACRTLSRLHYVASSCRLASRQAAQ